jgi:hypothetical protein
MGFEVLLFRYTYIAKYIYMYFKSILWRINTLNMMRYTMDLHVAKSHRLARSVLHVYHYEK